MDEIIMIENAFDKKYLRIYDKVELKHATDMLEKYGYSWYKEMDGVLPEIAEYWPIIVTPGFKGPNKLSYSTDYENYYIGNVFKEDHRPATAIINYSILETMTDKQIEVWLRLN